MQVVHETGNSTEQVKRGRGRPKGTGKKNADGTPIAQISFLPKPATWNYKDCEKFMKYWQSFNAEQSEHAEVRVYRNFPVIDRTLTGNTKKDIDIVSGVCPFGDNWMDDILHRYGTGDYTLYMTEQPGSRSVTRTLVKTIRDFDHRPPRIDLRELMMSDPTNASYLAGLRQRGVKLPGDTDTQQERENEEEMQVTAGLTGTIDKLTDKLLAERATPQQPIYSGDRDAIKTMADSAQAAVRLIEQTSAKILDAKGEQADPLKHVEAVVAMAERLNGGKGGNDSVLTMVLQDSMRRAEAAQARSDALMDRLLTPQSQQSAAPPKTLIEQLTELQQMRSLLKDVTGDGDDDEPRKRRNGSDPEGWMGLILKAAPTIGGMFDTLMKAGANMLYNQAVLRSGQGTPIPLTQASPQPQQQMEPEQPAVVATDADGNPYTPEEMAALQQYHPLLQMISPALIKHFNDETLDGSDFASWLIDSRSDGRTIYDSLKQIGKEPITAVLRSYPPLWNQIGVASVRLDAFLEEFLQRDELISEPNDPNEDD